MQMHHWLKVEPGGAEDPLQEVDRGDRDDREQRDAVPAQLHDPRDRVAVEDRVRSGRGSAAPPKRWNSDSVVSSIVAATTAPPWSSPIW